MIRALEKSLKIIQPSDNLPSKVFNNLRSALTH